MKKLHDPSGGGNGRKTFLKSTHKTEEAGKAPTRQTAKAPARQPKKAPTYYLTSDLLGVVSRDELYALLVSLGQHEWTRIRLYGLLILLSWICKQPAKGFTISAELADQYVSPLKRNKNGATIKEPLPLLCHLGIIEKTAGAVFAHVKVSSKYKLAASYAGKIQKFKVDLPPKTHSKLLKAESRCEHRLNRKYPWRETLRADMRKIGIAQEGRALIAEELRRGSGGSGLQGIIGAIDERRHTARPNERGTIITSISSLPRTLKPFLTLDGEPAVSCDVSHAHHCFLPRLLADRIAYKHREKPTGDLQHLEAERLRLVERLSGSDYYRLWCNDQTDDKERKEKKGLINALLNMPNSKCTANPFYQWMRSEFPLAYRVVEDIKRSDHRNLSKPLQRFTSNAINGALRQLQEEGIIAIPQTDAILCRVSHQERVSRVIGEWVYKESTGVRCKVSGVPFEG